MQQVIAPVRRRSYMMREATVRYTAWRSEIYSFRFNRWEYHILI
jgi:hypothetical protein